MSVTCHLNVVGTYRQANVGVTCHLNGVCSYRQANVGVTCHLNGVGSYRQANVGVTCQVNVVGSCRQANVGVTCHLNGVGSYRQANVGVTCHLNVVDRACKSCPRKRGLGQEVHILRVNIRTFVVVVIIELFPNSVFQLYYLKNYYMQKQWNTLPVIVITEIMNFNQLLWWLPWH